MTTLNDDEFGEITIRRSMRQRTVRLSVNKHGRLIASMPSYAPIFALKSLIRHSRDDLRKMLEHHAPSYSLTNGEQIGKLHKLVIIWGAKTSVKTTDSSIIVHLKEGDSIHNAAIENKVKLAIQNALRDEAKIILSPMIRNFAATYGYKYTKLKFTHATTRWGSCSTTGTISLNIAMMKLPDELIRYVLLHELAHTREMNHSTHFWKLVEQADPSYKLHRTMLKRHNPTI